MVSQFDVLIIGGGVVGTAIARCLSSRNAKLSIGLVEKEEGFARHQSGNNSGVVHAGYNQKPGTLKARLVVEGSNRLRAYCSEKNVSLDVGGILVVAGNEKEVRVIEELHRRGIENGADVRLVDGNEIVSIEPFAAGKAALHARDGGSFDAVGFVNAMAEDARISGVKVCLSEKVVALSEMGTNVTVRTNREELRTKLLVNAGGLQTDRIAHQLGCGLEYAVVPFRGQYYELAKEQTNLVRSHIYPTPDLAFPFLGVHFSRKVSGKVMVGPGALLSLGRETYKLGEISFTDIVDMARFPGFWPLALSSEMLSLAAREWQKSVFAQAVADEGRVLVPELKPEMLSLANAGIRAQLVKSDGTLVDDLLVVDTSRSLHVLNAVSPALTCALPFADYVVGMIEEKLGSL